MIYVDLAPRAVSLGDLPGTRRRRSTRVTIL
jgi:hypothetical protein